MWKDLTLKQKAEIMKMSVANGVTDINAIQQLYDNSVEHQYAKGGNTQDEENDKNQPLFDRNKVYNRVSGDWFDKSYKSNVHTIIDAIRHYFNNDDSYVENRLAPYARFKDLSYDDIADARKYINEHYDDLFLYEPKDREKVLTLLDRMYQEKAPKLLQHEDAKDIYLGLPQRYNTMADAEYEPTLGKLDNGKYIRYMRQPGYINDTIMPLYNDFKRKKMGFNQYNDPLSEDMLGNITPNGNVQLHDVEFLKNATMGSGIDPQRGEYASIYDRWDYNTNISDKSGDNVGKWIGGKPFDIYDRYYLDDYYGVDSRPWKTENEPGYYGGYLPEIVVTNKKALGGHLYKNAGPLDKAKDQPKYQYGIIEQILRENGVNFRVTSGARKPNQAGNAGKSSAHTYTIFGGSPGAIDIVPGVGSDWNTLFAQMSSPKVKRALAAYGLDILNETNPNVMASTKATGPHLHVGRGIKGQQGLGQIFGGTSYGGGKGDTYRLQYPSQRNSDYTPIYSQKAFEPIVIGGNNTSNPWLDYIGSMSSIGNQGISPATNTPTRPTNTGLNGIKSTFTPTDFSSLSNSSDVVSPLEPYAAKQNIEYGLGLEGNALWNSPYLMFDNHSAANGGHLFDTAGQMLIRDNAVNPALRYVYGDDYEERIRRLRNYRPNTRKKVARPNYNLEQRADVIHNTAEPTRKKIAQKQVDTPAKREKETREYKTRQERAKYTPANPRQASIGPYREKTALDKQAGRLYAAGEEKQKQEENMRNAGIILGNYADLVLSPLMGSTYVDMVDAYQRGKRGFWDVAGARFTDKDAWSKRNPGKALVTDIVTPSVLVGASKIVKGAGIPLGNGTKWHLKLPINENYYYRQGNNIIADAENTGVIAVKSKPSKDVVTSRGLVFNFGKTFDVPFFAKGSPWYGTNNKLEIIVNTGAGGYDWMPITKGGRFRPTADRTNEFVMRRVTPLVDGEAGLARASDFIGFIPRKLGYTSRRLGLKP